MQIDILTLFPEVFDPFLKTSIVGRAIAQGLAGVRLTNFRDFAKGVHRSVDDRPFGGGPGMVLMCPPLMAALEQVEKSGGAGVEPMRLLMTPQGDRLTQNVVRELAAEPWLILICGHYEGFDERIRTLVKNRGKAREISIGDYVLSGGEPAAMVLIDAVVRLQPGALGHEQSAECESFSEGLLEYPQYTRPREYEGLEVPPVLLSGDHGKIAAWRRLQQEERTRERRPDLM
jgi:tRNA (guanine37-N1)-methyltransferase